MHAARHYGVEAVGITLSRNQAEYAKRRGRRRPASTASRSASRTTATSTAASTRSARSACSSTSAWRGSASTSRTCYDLLGAGGRLLNHGISRPAGAPVAFQPPRLHRPLRVPRRRAARGRHGRVADAAIGLRGAPRREPARALRAHAAAVGAQPRGELGRRGRRRRPGPRPACGGSTWPARRSTSRTAATQIHQVLACRADGGRSGMPWRPDW